jgi:aspartyl-tRNA(Asn)/glutamyl-tRNA(Gln) amidotransferase subunit C
MKITREEAKAIADLAHLAFDDAALDRMAAEMTKILTYIDQLAEVEVDVAADSSQSDPTPLRNDVIGSQPADPERNAPAWDSGHFVVPKVIGD